MQATVGAHSTGEIELHTGPTNQLGGINVNFSYMHSEIDVIWATIWAHSMGEIELQTKTYKQILGHKCKL